MMDVDAEVFDGPISLDIRRSIEQAITDVIPDGHTQAVVAVVNMDGFSATYAAKLGDHWKLDAEIEKKWSGNVTGSVKILGSW